MVAGKRVLKSVFLYGPQFLHVCQEFEGGGVTEARPLITPCQ